MLGEELDRVIAHLEHARDQLREDPKGINPLIAANLAMGRRIQMGAPATSRLTPSGCTF